MKALVTGAAGFIGSHLSAALLDRGAQVTGLDCFTDYYARAIKESNLEHNRVRQGFRFIEARIQDADLPRVLEGVTHVFHLAAQAGVRKSWGRDFRTYTENNVDASQHLLEACAGLPLHRFVYASSSSVYGDNATIPMREEALPQPVSPYGVTKLAAEHLCRLYFVNHGVPATSLRYFTVYGPRQRPDMAFHRFLRAALNGDPITLYGDGEQTRDFTYVTNVVDGVIRAAETPAVAGEVFNVATSSRISLNQLLATLKRIFGSSVEPIYKDARPGDVRDSQADITKAQQKLGYEPAVGLEEGLRETVAWYRSQA